MKLEGRRSLTEIINEMIIAFRDYCNLERQRFKNLEVTVVAATSIETMLSSLEAIYAEIQYAIAKLHRKQMTLAEGRISQDMLPTYQLHKVLATVEQFGLVSLNDSWYYTHATAELVYQEGSSLIYRAKLPLVSRHIYQSYLLYSWPLPMNASTRDAM